MKLPAITCGLFFTCCAFSVDNYAQTAVLNGRGKPPAPKRPGSQVIPEFQNDSVRVQRVTFAIGGAVDLPHDALLVCIKGCLLRLSAPARGGKSRPIDLNPGDTAWASVEFLGGVLTNTGASGTEVLLVNRPDPGPTR